ncbi:MAG: DUF3390 domain-containing protein, partial [Candidatus Dadabacteria bacterium]|nr:DUF3390 domain-containing protein [Candidatus Dadabacteria bacterium]
MKIDFPKVLLDLRRQVIQRKIKDKSREGVVENILFKTWKNINLHPNILKLLNYILSYLPESLIGIFLRRWAKSRDLPKFSKKTFRQIW